MGRIIFKRSSARDDARVPIYLICSSYILLPKRLERLNLLFPGKNPARDILEDNTSNSWLHSLRSLFGPPRTSHSAIILWGQPCTRKPLSATSAQFLIDHSPTLTTSTLLFEDIRDALSRIMPHLCRHSAEIASGNQPESP